MRNRGHFRELRCEQCTRSGSRWYERIENTAMKPDKIDDGFLHLLLAGPARPAPGEVCGGSRYPIRWKLAIGRKQKLLIGEM